MIYGGLSKHHPFYMAWCNMKTRCNNPKSGKWEHYGGRGITYDPAWERFENFYKDMFPMWFEGLSLNRIDNDGNYCADNCDWILHLEQCSNRRPRTLRKYCLRGHEFTEDNIVYKSEKIRLCKTCLAINIENSRDRRNANKRINRLAKKIAVKGES